MHGGLASHYDEITGEQAGPAVRQTSVSTPDATTAQERGIQPFHPQACAAVDALDNEAALG
jgi:hypothetical protein